MTSRRLLSLAATATCALVLATTAQAVTITTFTGGDGGEGLDLDGKFIYAVHADTAGSHQVRDALFLNRNQPGVTVTSNSQTVFGGPTYGGATPSTNDSNLRLVMDFVKFDSGAPGQMPITLANVTPGKTYQLQLLYNEACCDRSMDVFVDGTEIASSFIPGNLQTPGVRNQGTGVVITHTFTATSSNVSILMRGDAAGADQNPIFDALTLEELPTNVSIGTFTGAAPGQGLDLSGLFVYAAHAAADGQSFKIGDATFRDRNQPGVTMGGNAQTPFGSPTYGAPAPSAADLALRQVMDFVKFDSVDLNNPLAIGTLPINLDGLIVGEQYKLQLLFNEQSSNRIMDVFVEGIQIADEFNPGALQGGFNQGIGAVITYSFIATDTMLNIVIRGDLDLGFSGVDRNPIIDALTLEIATPEPASAMLGLISFAALGLRRRQRTA